VISNVGRRRPRIAMIMAPDVQLSLACAPVDLAPPVSVRFAGLGAVFARFGHCSHRESRKSRRKNRLMIAAAPSRCAQGAAAPSRCAHGARAPSRCACGAGALRIAPVPFWPPLRRRAGGGVRPTPAPS
jgi:hypothetical protein